MYARLLFVVVGILGPVLPVLSFPPLVFRELRLGFAGGYRIYAGCMNEAIRPGPENPPQAAALAQLSVIVPTFNERDNVTTLFRRLETALAGVAFEVIFVDDNSPDGTWDLVRSLARQDSRVRCIRRIGRRGLSGACIEGILASSAPCAAVIDADLQHDETQLPKMLALLQGGDGFPGAGAGQADRRCGVAALPAVCDGRIDRPVRASGRAVRRA